MKRVARRGSGQILWRIFGKMAAPVAFVQIVPRPRGVGHSVPFGASRDGLVAMKGIARRGSGEIIRGAFGGLAAPAWFGRATWVVIPRCYGCDMLLLPLVAS